MPSVYSGQFEILAARAKASCCRCNQPCLLELFSDASSGPGPSHLRTNIILTAYIYIFSKWDSISLAFDSLRTHKGN